MIRIGSGLPPVGPSEGPPFRKRRPDRDTPSRRKPPEKPEPKEEEQRRRRAPDPGTGTEIDIDV